VRKNKTPVHSFYTAKSRVDRREWMSAATSFSVASRTHAATVRVLAWPATQRGQPATETATTSRGPAAASSAAAVVLLCAAARDSPAPPAWYRGTYGAALLSPLPVSRLRLRIQAAMG
jgi:hypothetical protein